MQNIFIRLGLSFLIFASTYMLFNSAFLESIHIIVNKPRTWNDFKIINQTYMTWGDHNIVFLISIVCASYFSGFACASTTVSNFIDSKRINLGLVWSIVVSAALAYIYFIEFKVEVGQFYFKSFPITSLIATIACLYFSFVGFINGEKFQNNFYPNSFFGINKINLIWILFPIQISPSYFILTGLVHSIIKSNTLLWADFRFSYFLWLLTIPSIIAWLAIVFSVTGILQNKFLINFGGLQKLLIVLAIIVFGSLGVTLLEMGSGSIISFLIKLINN